MFWKIYEIYVNWRRNESEKKICNPYATIGGLVPDKSAIEFQVLVSGFGGMKKSVRSDNPVRKSAFNECIISTSMRDLTSVYPK